MRLNRFLARSGVASRRKAEEIILAVLVSVNGKKVTSLATVVDPKIDKVTADGNEVHLKEFVYYALNKPKGYTVTKNDIHAKKTVFELLPNDSSLFSVGRLDRDTIGLLIITNDGDFGQKMIHPSNKVGKKYHILLKKAGNKSDFNRLLKGVRLSDGLAKATELKVISNRELLLTIEEGRNRIIRRMIKAINNEVCELKRIQIGDIKLDIEEGKYRQLTEQEIASFV